jgi:hypothetical protein
MDEDALKVLDIQQSGQISLILFGIGVFGEIAEFGRFNPKCHLISSIRNGSLFGDFNLSIVKSSIVVEVSHLVFYRVADVDPLAVGDIVQVTYGVGLLQCSSLKP